MNRATTTIDQRIFSHTVKTNKKYDSLVIHKFYYIYRRLFKRNKKKKLYKIKHNDVLALYSRNILKM